MNEQTHLQNPLRGSLPELALPSVTSRHRGAKRAAPISIVASESHAGTAGSGAFRTSRTMTDEQPIAPSEPAAPQLSEAATLAALESAADKSARGLAKMKEGDFAAAIELFSEALKLKYEGARSERRRC